MLSEEDLKEVQWLAERIRQRAEPPAPCICCPLPGKPCVCGCVVPPTMSGAVGMWERRAVVAICKPGVLHAVRRLGEVENAGGLALAKELQCLYQDMAAEHEAREARVANVGASGAGPQGALQEAEEPAKVTAGAQGQGLPAAPTPLPDRPLPAVEASQGELGSSSADAVQPEVMDVGKRGSAADQKRCHPSRVPPTEAASAARLAEVHDLQERFKAR